jgi:hypothetical protein
LSPSQSPTCIPLSPHPTSLFSLISFTHIFAAFNTGGSLNSDDPYGKRGDRTGLESGGTQVLSDGSRHMAESTSIALETESHGADTLHMLVGQRETSIDHTAFPFSQSTLQVDGHNFPPPDTPGSHHQNLPTGAFAPSLRRPGTPPLPTVQIDVYNHAYNYPLAKQLFSIAEQNYYSPISARVLPGSAASASPGADGVLNFGFGNGSGRERMAAEGDKERERDWERGSTRARFGRTGSVGWGRLF